MNARSLFPTLLAFFSLILTMEGAASTSGVKKSVVKRKLDSGEDIVAALDEELGYESDSSDASWFSDLEQSPAIAVSRLSLSRRLERVKVLCG